MGSIMAACGSWSPHKPLGELRNGSEVDWLCKWLVPLIVPLMPVVPQLLKDEESHSSEENISVQVSVSSASRRLPWSQVLP